MCALCLLLFINIQQTHLWLFISICFRLAFWDCETFNDSSNNNFHECILICLQIENIHGVYDELTFIDPRIKHNETIFKENAYHDYYLKDDPPKFKPIQHDESKIISDEGENCMQTFIRYIMDPKRSNVTYCTFNGKFTYISIYLLILVYL